MSTSPIALRALKRIGGMVRTYFRLRRMRQLGLSYRRPNFIFIDNFPSTPVVVDAGCSYEADFSIMMIQEFNATAYAIDPTRKHRPALEKLVERYPKNLTYLPVALGPSDKVIKFFESVRNESGSVRTDHVNVRMDLTTTYDVEMISLVTLFDRIGTASIDLVKLDLEGAEYELLSAVPPNCLRRCAQIFVEFHHHAVGAYTLEDTNLAVQTVVNAGFLAHTIDDANYLFVRR